jgi:mannose-6-phosphate isomerase-like protein (cupin superfamily)
VTHAHIRSGEIEPLPSGAIRFEGEGHGSGISFFLVDAEPGGGPGLHRHPYSETWIVRAGRGLFVAEGEELEAGPGDIVVVGPDTPHKFTSLGPGRLEMTCIHDSPAMIQEELEEPA